MMHEAIEGKGTLRRVGLPPDEWTVRYQFDIQTTVIQKPGFPVIEGHSSGRGTVTSLNEDVIPNGTYELTAQSGETLRVKNLGAVWAIVSLPS